MGIGPTVDVLLIRRHSRVHGFVEAGDSAIRVRFVVDVHVVFTEGVVSSDARHCYGYFILLLRWRTAMRLWCPRRQHNKL